tara:strand:+ start:132 stop:593 length:462 start_codon:yes stop_codon:yes gene_type:complete
MISQQDKGINIIFPRFFSIIDHIFIFIISYACLKASNFWNFHLSNFFQESLSFKIFSNQLELFEFGIISLLIAVGKLIGKPPYIDYIIENHFYKMLILIPFVIGFLLNAIGFENYNFILRQVIILLIVGIIIYNYLYNDLKRSDLIINTNDSL